jgi:hypothetical protein
MAIGVPTLFTSTTQVAVADGAQIPAVANVPLGALIVAAFFNWVTSGSSPTGAVTDSAGNAYSLAINSPPTSTVYGCSIYYCANCAAVASGSGWISIAGTGQNYNAAACYVTGANGGLDRANQTTGLTNTSSSVSTGTLLVPNEIVFGAVAMNVNDTFTQTSGFNKITTLGTPPTSIEFDYLTVGSTTSVPYSLSWTISSRVSQIVASFQQSVLISGFAASEY